MNLKLLAMSGPNLDRLGQREPEVYGTQSLSGIHTELQTLARELQVSLECYQSNHEGDLLDRLNQAEARGIGGILINPGALTHYSWALHDSIKGCGVPVVELHISNPQAREQFRHHSCVSPAALGTIAGFGKNSYLLALRALADHLAAGSQAGRR